MEKTIILQKFTRNMLDKLMLTGLCVMFYFWHVGFSAESPWQQHVLFNFCHVNIFHLIINLCVLWQIQNRIPVVEGLLTSFIASYLPMYVTEPTMGLSGFLFASFGIMWGKTNRPLDAMKAALPFILFTMIFNNVNGLLHLYTFILGYVSSCVFNKSKATAHHG